MTKNKTYNYIYKTRNVINGKEYIGVHSTDKLFDGYIGNGIKSQKDAIRHNKAYNSPFVSAVVKYGYDFFIKEILYFFETYEQALLKEEELVNIDYIKRAENYNVKVGGISGAKINSMKDYELIDFEGNEYKGINVRDFCRKYDLSYTGIKNVVAGKSKTSQGYYTKSSGYKPQKILIFNTETDEIFETYILQDWCREHLPQSLISNGKSSYLAKVLTGSITMYDKKWWVCYEDQYDGTIGIDSSILRNKFKYTISDGINLLTFKDVSKFCRENNCNRKTFKKLLNKNIDKYKGYTLIKKELRF